VGWLEALLAAMAGLLGGFISTLASNGSAVTLPALKSLGLPEHVANGTNRLSVVALGLVGTVGFYRRGPIDWRKGSWIAALVGSGTIVLDEAVLDGVVTAGLLFVLGLLLVEPGRWLRGREGTLRPFGLGQATAYFVIGVYAGLVVLGSGFFLLAALVFLTGCDLRHGNAIKAFVLLVVGLQSLLIFGEAGEVDWIAGIPLALGSATGAYAASLVAAQDWARVWVYRLLVLVVILAIVHLLVVDTREFVGRGLYLLHY
jgi:uncharacterized membrane protein YfcA